MKLTNSDKKFAWAMSIVVILAVLVFVGFLGSFTGMPDPIHHDFVWDESSTRSNVFCAEGGKQVGLVQNQSWGDDGPWRAYFDWKEQGDYNTRSNAQAAVEVIINKTDVCVGGN